MSMIEDLAAEVAHARGDARTALDFVRGTPSLIGLRERVQANADAIQFAIERDQERTQAIESWLRKIDDRLASIESRRVHPAAVWLITMALCVASFAAAWSVWGKQARDEYAQFVGCSAP